MRALRWVRRLYTLSMFLVLPLMLYRLLARSLRTPGYRQRIGERFGRFRAPPIGRSIWVHAVSVGEFNAALPLIEALLSRCRDHTMVVTTITPTGSERVTKVLGARVVHVYLPYDLPHLVRRFLDRIRPRVAVVMETEIWPNVFFALRERQVPLLIANARVSQRSLRGYGPAQPLIREALRTAAWIGAQSRTDAERFLRLGAEPQRLEVVGNIKFDMHVLPELAEQGRRWRERLGARRPVWIAASTHDGEEAPVLDAHARILGRFPDALLILAPRHPERFRAAFALCRSYGFRSALRSDAELEPAGLQCFVVDSLGELLQFYAAADVAFVGGSLDRIGGHNVLEPAALGRPVLIGPHTDNFAEVTAQLIEAGAAQRVADGNALGRQVLAIFAQPEIGQRMGAAALAAVARQRGAVDRVLAQTLAALDGRLRPGP